MKFNPPPNWPASPEGFTPGPDWAPDPALPPPPPGWQLWVEDGVPLPGETTQSQRHHKQATTSFFVGVAVFLAGAISTIIASSNGGFLWYGGMIFGVIVLVRAFVTYRASRKDGAPALSSLAKGVVAVGLVAVLGTGVVAATRFISTETTNDAVGSCWHVTTEGDASLVSCDDEHEYKAVSEVDNEADCPNDEYLEASDGQGVLCLQQD